jgi:hypothetical protein
VRQLKRGYFSGPLISLEPSIKSGRLESGHSIFGYEKLQISVEMNLVPLGTFLFFLFTHDFL